MEALLTLWQSTGIANLTWRELLMLVVGVGLIYLAIAKRFEPLLLLPIGFGAILSNIPVAGMAGPDGMIGMIYHVGSRPGSFRC
jgi:carboxybiotin decarboxylase